MRQIVVDNKLVPNDTEPKRQRNVNADVVGYAKSLEVDYDHIGAAELTSGDVLKIETSPEGQEIYEADVNVGDTVYWAVKHANA